MITKKTVNSLTYKIVGYAIEIHKELGPGLLESVYETCMMHLLTQNGHKVTRQTNVKINFKGIELSTQLRYDMVVYNLIVIENKTVEAFHPLHTAQTLSYMKLLEIPKGIILNYNCTNIYKEGQKTLVNQYFEELPDE